MRTLSACLLSLCSLHMPLAQGDYAFTFDVKDPDSVTHIFINMDFAPIDEIPSTVGAFTNLKELTVFGRFFSDHLGPTIHKQLQLPAVFNLNDPLSMIDSTRGFVILRDRIHFHNTSVEPINIGHIPEEIGLCTKLEILQIPEGRITSLPSSFAQLKRLRSLRLPDRTNLDNLMPILLQLPSLDSLHCWGCELSEENMARLSAQNPQMNFHITEEDLFRNFWNHKTLYGVMAHCECGPFGFSSGSKMEARMYLHSTPADQRRAFKMTYHEKPNRKPVFR